MLRNSRDAAGNAASQLVNRGGSTRHAHRRSLGSVCQRDVRLRRWEAGHGVRSTGPPEAIVFAGDGQRISKWGRLLEKAGVPSTMIVGVHGLTDEMLRLHEYSPGFEPERFAAHEKFFVEDVRRWTESRFGVALPT